MRTDELPHLPSRLINRPYRLPNESERYGDIPEAPTIRKLFGLGNRQPKDRDPILEAIFFEGDEGVAVDLARANIHRAKNGTSKRTNPTDPRILAIASILEGLSLRELFTDYPHLREPFNTHARFRMGTWQNAGLVAASPDGAWYGLCEKDRLHPIPGFCGRLGMVGGGVEFHEAALWDTPAERATVAMIREIYEEVADPSLADELIGRMNYAGAHVCRCDLSMPNGQPTEGRVHIFIATAKDDGQWERWLSVYDNPHGLMEARPRLLSRQELIDHLERERSAAEARRRYLERAPRDRIHAEARLVHDRFARQDGQTYLAWHAERERGAVEGAFPTRDRGDFAFIAGHGAAIQAALLNAGLLAGR